jgi:protein TonB
MSTAGNNLQPDEDDGADPEARERPAVAPANVRPLHSDARALLVRERPDPFARVRTLGGRENRLGMAVGLAFALSVHGAGAAHGLSALLDMSAFAALVQSAVRDDVRSTYAVEVAEQKPPPPPPPAEEPKPEPEPQARVPNRGQQAEAPPPAPAQAGKVLTAATDPDAPLDLTGDGFVTGDGDRYVGGVTSSKGTAQTPVRQALTKPEGKVGGTGKGRPDADLTKPDQSRSPVPLDTVWNDCGFPPEADTDQINYMKVRVVVTVGLDGRAQKVTVLSDPGHGFGRLAQQCAYRKTYGVGLNSEGKPIVSTTPPIGVTFQR